jgi:hypothetical protein
VSDRVHNVLLNLIALCIGIDALFTLGHAFFGDHGGFGTLWWFLVAIFLLLVAMGFKKRKGWAFLAVSTGLLVGWMTQLVRTIVVYDAGEMSKGHGILVSFIVITVLIGYLGRWPMERRFRPHLDH